MHVIYQVPRPRVRCDTTVTNLVPPSFMQLQFDLRWTFNSRVPVKVHKGERVRRRKGGLDLLCLGTYGTTVYNRVDPSLPSNVHGCAEVHR